VLLVGGASRRFGAPKALAQFEGETLAERAWRLLGDACDERLAVGKTLDKPPLPFPVLDDASDIHAPLVGIVAGLREATNELCVFLPVDLPADLRRESVAARRRSRHCGSAAHRPAPRCLSPNAPNPPRGEAVE